MELESLTAESDLKNPTKHEHVHEAVLAHAHEHSFWDKVGIAVSSVCFLHCLLTPFWALSLPFISSSFHHPLFHIVIALMVLPVGIYAFWQGYREHHQKRVLFLGIPGLVIVAGVAFVPHDWIHLVGHIQVNVVGSLLLIAAHILNRRACRCQHSH